ncbi:MAG: hypothetical protein HY856_03555 [Burkholderiales bacterium]|nr:hypothetical protein [Burkholderiales bacterium]
MDDTFFYRFSGDELERLRQLKQHAVDWCSKHQWQLGVTEMALGAALLTAGWQNGAIQMGVDFVAHKLNPGWAAEITGGASGLAGLATYFVGNVGVAALGGAFCIPALAIAGGAALVLGLAGYGAAQLVQEFLHQAPSLGQFTTAAGLVAVGSWLIIDGARRVPLIREGLAQAKEAGLHLARVAGAFVVDSSTAFATLVKDEVAPFLQKLAKDPATGAAILGSAGLGTAGALIAPSLVTVMGSSTLGSAALAVGLVSAPVWPIVAGVGAGLAAGYGLWKFLAGGNEPPEPPGLPLLPTATRPPGLPPPERR